ncbi:DNA-binding protein c1d [Boothiomyces macroporosus]|uniref:Exosome complex protein n=1 Tax=Boothiomyces macroporosus TaxID=261099 RepID=A0AAD5Y5G9_9FUNG|nr:DNA-binding protein c1d [Boothiomyces macroporosus]
MSENKELQLVESKLTTVLQVLEPLFQVPIEEHYEKLDQRQKASLLVTLAFAINTLTFVYLKIQGVNPKSHRVKAELARCKTYFDKLSFFRKEEPTLKVDEQAAKRFIKSALEKVDRDDAEMRASGQSGRENNKKKRKGVSKKVK